MQYYAQLQNPVFTMKISLANNDDYGDGDYNNNQDDYIVNNITVSLKMNMTLTVTMIILMILLVLS